MANELTTFEFDAENRRPWNNKIYPGNYVAQLNAYRDQGVVALPALCSSVASVLWFLTQTTMAT